jgi:[CysO sulfur-carrier protein]-S-L-cysteine hydrolase
MVNSTQTIGIPDRERRSEVIEIPLDLRDRMVAHALEGLPNEACGLLAGTGATAEHFFPMTNADHSPVTYRLDPKEQIEVFDEIDEKGWELQGIFHSHTHSEAYPSETDRSQAFYPEAHYLLVSLQDRANPVLRGYTIRDGEIEEQEVRIV